MELEHRFGLAFEVLDHDYVGRIRRERGYATNPWATHSLFLVSHRLLIDEDYTAPLRDWLGELRPGSLLILDEAHHAAPATSSRYAIDSKFTRAIRDIAPRFEHRLFLSATPHNGHSNSFSSLLEILDPQRFCRGVPVKGKTIHVEVMVRRLKDGLRQVVGSEGEHAFPERIVVRVDIDGLPVDAPELRLAERSDEYRRLREAEMEGESKRLQATAGILITGLQQRLLSSVEAFSRTLRVHRRTVEKQKATRTKANPPAATLLRSFADAVDADDDRASLLPEELSREEDSQIEAATAAAFSAPAKPDVERLLETMTAIAEKARGEPDARVKYLVGWIREKLLAGKTWTNTRVIVFTEFGATLTYLRERIESAIAGTDRPEGRLALSRGSTPTAEREEIKRAFNTEPARHPLRVLLCTDAAREGINLQSHCSDLFHFDVPWNPSRLEQRNGRIDRKLQPSPEVRCYYFVYKQRPEDRILKAIVRKTKTIKPELGSLAQVIEGRLTTALARGFSRAEIDGLEREIDTADLDAATKRTVIEELESSRGRREELAGQIDRLRDGLEASRLWVGLKEDDFKAAISSALELVGVEPLKPDGTSFVFPELDKKAGGDPSWADTLDTLRTPRERDQKFWDWRRQSTIRPIVFEDPGSLTEDVVHLHFEHPVVKRLLGRFVAQGFVLDDLSRACFAQSSDSIPRVVLLGRLCLYGAGAARLHEEIIHVTARRIEPDRRKGSPLAPYARETELFTLGLLAEALAKGIQPKNATMFAKLQAAGPQDVAELLPHLEKRGELLAEESILKLAERGRDEAAKMLAILRTQRKNIAETAEKNRQILLTDFLDDEKQQMEADRIHLTRRLTELETELAREPARIRDVYDVKARRVEPVGLCYLWPSTG